MNKQEYIEQVYKGIDMMTNDNQVLKDLYKKVSNAFTEFINSVEFADEVTRELVEFNEYVPDPEKVMNMYDLSEDECDECYDAFEEARWNYIALQDWEMFTNELVYNVNKIVRILNNIDSDNNFKEIE